MVSENKRKDFYKGCKGSLTKLEFQEALSKRSLQARVLHERRLSLNRADNVYNTRDICREQAKLRKKLQRLENVKRKNKENSFLDEEMRLLLQNELSSVGNEKFPKSITSSNALEVPKPAYRMKINSNNRQLLTPINEEPTRAHSRALSPSPSLTPAGAVAPVNILPAADTETKTLTPSTELTKTRTVTQVHNLSPIHGLELTRAVKERRALTPTRDIITTRALKTTQTLSLSSVLLPTFEITPTDELSPTHGVTHGLTPLHAITPVRAVTPTRVLTPTSELTRKRAVTPTRALTPTHALTPTRALTPTSELTRKRAVTPTRALTHTRALTPLRYQVQPPVLTPTSALSPTQTLTSKAVLTPLPPHTVTDTRALTPTNDSKSENTLNLTPSRALTPIRSVTPSRSLILTEDLVTQARALTPSRALTPIRSVTSNQALNLSEDSMTPACEHTPVRVLTPIRSVSPTRALTPFLDITQAMTCTLDATPMQNNGLVTKSLKDKEEKTATELEVLSDSEKSKKPSKPPRASPRRCSIKLPRRESVILSCPNIRRGSLPASLYLLAKSVPKFRRFSTPANSLMLPVIQVETADDEADDNQGKLNQLYTKAIETIQRVDLEQLKQKTGRTEQGSSSDFDLESLRKLQAILTNEKNYSDRFGQKDDPRRLEMSQKRKIEELESILKKLDPNFGNTFRIDPFKELECTYLRLTKSNVENLENMIREQGKDPGIHNYTDVTQYDIWSGLKEECSEKER